MGDLLLTDRLPPHSIEAEQSVLGAGLMSANALEYLVTNLSENDFHFHAHRAVFTAMAELRTRGAAVDFLTVADELRRRGQFDGSGGDGYLVTLNEAVPTAAHVEHYGDIVRDYADLRRLILAGQEVTALGFSGAADGSVEETLAKAEHRVLSVRRQGERLRVVDGAKAGTATQQRYIERLEQGGPSGYGSGFHALAKTLKFRYRPGEMVVVAGKTGGGKTSFALQEAWNICREGGRAMIFSVEMSEEQVTCRTCCQRARLDSTKVEEGTLSDGEWSRYQRAAEELREFGERWSVADRFTPTPAEVMALARRRKQRYGGVDLVIVDHLQLLEGGKRADNRTREIADISRALKLGSVDLGTCVLALSQYNREVEKSEDKRPRLRHLREGGSIEADADAVMLLWQPAEWPEQVDERTSINTLVLVDKNRFGPLGKVPLDFRPVWSSFYGEETRHDEADAPQERSREWVH